MSLNMSSNGHFSTSDTALAAYLISEGFPEPIIQHTFEKECVFCFPKVEDMNYDKYYRNFKLGIANGNINVFFKSYKELLKRVHRG